MGFRLYGEYYKAKGFTLSDSAIIYPTIVKPLILGRKFSFSCQKVDDSEYVVAINKMANLNVILEYNKTLLFIPLYTKQVDITQYPAIWENDFYKVLRVVNDSPFI